MNKHEILKFIDQNSGPQKYQTIIFKNEVIRPGTEKCHISWNNIIKTGINFENKSLCDLGCYHGYFMFKAEMNGVSELLGIDNNDDAIKVINKLIECNNSKASVIKRNIGKENFLDKKYDIVFALNMLHHVKRINGNNAYISTLKEIFENCKEVVFEVNNNELKDIDNIAKEYNFTLIKKVVSHRNTMFGQRFILYYKK